MKRYAYTKTGKFHYNAPEIELAKKFNNKVDIYALGCIIYELFTLNEYFIDKVIYEKNCKIDTNFYKIKWQKLIDSLVEKDSRKRPNIEEIYNYIIKDENEILLNIQIKEEDVARKIYFLNNEEDNNNEDKNDLIELNESNVDLYINNKKVKYDKFFIPEKEGIYIIRLIFYLSLKNYNYMFYNCKNIIKIDLFSFDIRNNTNIKNMF